MCRIFGISYGPDGPDAEDWTPTEFGQIMFPALVKGGPHAFGWMSWDGESIHHEKHPGRVDTDEAMGKIDIDPNAKWFVGHTRWATHGSPEDMRNNHPLVHGRFIGVHNGVLQNHSAILSITGREDPKTEVDSEAIFAAVNKWGHRVGLSKILGAMVAVYANTEHHTRTLHIARTHGRDLFYARTVAGSLIFASEEQAIRATGIKLQRSPTPVPPYKLLRVREGRVTERVDFGVRPRSFTPTKGRTFSASGTRQAMFRAGQREIDEAHNFIQQERAKTRVNSAVKRKASSNLATMTTPIDEVRRIKVDPDWGMVSDDGKRWWVGNGKWVSENEFIAILMDELGWD